MKRRVILVLGLSVSFAAGLLVGSVNRPKLATAGPNRPTDAAYRDGYYQARLDVAEGRDPHPSVGRWSTELARASFLAGYQQGYLDYAEAKVRNQAEPSIAELAATGYRDGMLDGTRHRLTSSPYQPEQTANFRDAGLAYFATSIDSEQFKGFYRAGYMSGYEQAYHAQPKPQNVTDQR